MAIHCSLSHMGGVGHQLTPLIWGEGGSLVAHPI